MKTTQIVVLALFIVGAIGGVIAFATYRSEPAGNVSGLVSIWGTLPETQVKSLIQVITKGKKGYDIRYTEFSKETLDREVVEAIASGRGPDAILLPQDFIIRFEDKILPIPFETYPARDFQNTFLEEGELYLTSEGVLGIPFSVDPLVMYWNRDMFANAGLANAPKTWNEIVLLPNKLTEKDKSLNITKSAVAFGEYRNVTNAKEILSAMFLQSGNSITERTDRGLRSAIADDSSAGNILGFYTEFANPVKSIYSWNKSLPSSKNAFLSEDLAIYFGFASELQDLRKKNPNLNFGVAPFPQLLDARVKKTFGRLNAFAVLKTSSNAGGALNAGLLLSSKEAISKWSESTLLPPVRRDLLTDVPSDPALSVFAESAIQSRAWFDINPTDTNKIFSSMIESITSGKLRAEDSVAKANSEFKLLGLR